MTGSATNSTAGSANKVYDLMIEHNVGVRSYRVGEFKRLDEDFFAEE